MRARLLSFVPMLGAAGFVLMTDLSLKRSGEFVLWNLVTTAWILVVFAALARRRLRRRLLWVSAPTVAMIALSTAMSLLFLNLVSPRRGFILFFGLVLYLFLEHVRRETAHDEMEERLTIAEFARMINIGSLFLLASAGIGAGVFLPVSPWWTAAAMAAIAVLWSLHLYSACILYGKPALPRVFLTAAIVFQTYVVALRLPTSMFVGGALVGLVYYVAAGLLPIEAPETIPRPLVRKYLLYAGGLLLFILATARWV